MLTKFAAKNYRGFKNRIEWDLSHPSNYTFNNDAVRNGIVKNGIIYGPNGAGKSNFRIGNIRHRQPSFSQVEEA